MNNNNSKTNKILVVDDNLKNIQVLATILKDNGYSVGFAMDGKQALSILDETSEYDLILMDIDMPVMDGYEACTKIRKNEKYNDLPIIFLTAHADTTSVINGFKAGAQDYVQKPFNSDELLARVSTQIELRDKTNQLHLMNQVLEEKVEERTRRLREAYKKLSALEKTKSDFITLISHELRTPMFTIRGFAHLLSETILNEEQKKYLTLLVASSERLVDFSETAILINQLKLKQYDIEKTNQNINIIINNAILKFKSQLDEKKINIVKSDFRHDVSLFIDAGLFSKAIECILDNAIRFSPEGSIIIINSRIESDKLVITISDSGPGFSKEALAQLFELFTTVDIMHHSKGFGLGLSTVFLIMDIHNGMVKVNNTDTGAEVSVFMPFIRQ